MKVAYNNEMEDDTETEYIYLLREREFIRLKEPCYKVGRTKQTPNDRFSGYPKGSEIILYVAVPDSIAAEKQVITVFKRDFKQRKDYGNEYFEGESIMMIKSILQVVTKTPGLEDIKQESELRLRLLNESIEQNKKYMNEVKTKLKNVHEILGVLMIDEDDNKVKKTKVPIEQQETKKKSSANKEEHIEEGKKRVEEENPDAIIKKLMEFIKKQEQVLEPADSASLSKLKSLALEYLSGMCNQMKLKEVCSFYKVPISGNKNELATRIIDKMYNETPKTKNATSPDFEFLNKAVEI
jgi:hypothetical protein